MADIEVLVNAAGDGHYGLHEELTPKKIQALVRTNLEIPLLLTNRLLRVLKKNHVTREYTVTVSGEAVTQNVKIHLKGDINGDGKVTIGDVNRANLHAKGKSKLTLYEFACADINGDGKVTISDVNRANLHMKGKSLLW